MNRREFTRIGVAAGLSAALAPAVTAKPGSGRPAFKVRRLPGNPIIRPGMDERMRAEAARYGYVNVNGPSLIRVPAWVEKPLGKYYLYFAHHKGEYIRLAYADELSGPWRTYEPGALELKDSFFPTEAPAKTSLVSSAAGLWKRNPPEVAWALTRVGLAARLSAEARKVEGAYGSSEDRPHIASPDLIIDHDRRELRMYYHGMLEDSVQMSRVALSKDGIYFQARPELLSSPYLRMFRYRGEFYGIGMPGIFYHSRDGLSGFAARPGLLFGVNLRHTALLVRGSNLYIFFSRVGDAPERILCSVMDLSPADWQQWKPSAPVEVIRPELFWEGSEFPVEPSRRGELTLPANQLRDPAVFEDEGLTWLLYAGAGEQALAIARLEIDAGVTAGS